MRTKVLLPIAIFAAMIFVVSVLIFARPKPTPAPPSTEVAHVNVSVLPAKAEQVSLSVTAQGTVEPKRQIDLIAQVSGQIVAVEKNFVDGGFFKASEILLQIDDRGYKAAVLAAKAQLASAKQRVAEEQGMARQARREWRDLGNQSANDLFMRKPQLAAAQANLASAEGALAMAELDLERTRVVVPFDGRVKALHADLGQFVNSGSVLATVYDSSLVEIRLPLTEKQASLVDLPLTPQLEATEILPPVTVRATVAGEPHSWQGVLARTDAFIDSKSRMYYAVVEVANPFNIGLKSHATPLLPGLFVEADISGKALTDVIALPRTALFEQDKLVILDADNKTQIQKAQVLHRTSQNVWLRAPIASGTLIAIEKQSLIPQGTQVEPQESSGLIALAVEREEEQAQ